MSPSAAVSTATVSMGTFCIRLLRVEQKWIEVIIPDSNWSTMKIISIVWLVVLRRLTGASGQTGSNRSRRDAVDSDSCSVMIQNQLQAEAFPVSN